MFLSYLIYNYGSIIYNDFRLVDLLLVHVYIWVQKPHECALVTFLSQDLWLTYCKVVCLQWLAILQIRLKYLLLASGVWWLQNSSWMNSFFFQNLNLIFNFFTANWTTEKIWNIFTVYYLNFYLIIININCSVWGQGLDVQNNSV